VTVGGTSSITGPFLASILIGIGDVAGQVITSRRSVHSDYTIMIVVLIGDRRVCSRGKARGKQIGNASPACKLPMCRADARRARWTPLEIAFWLVAFSTIYLLPGRHLILTEIATGRCSRSRST